MLCSHSVSPADDGHHVPSQRLHFQLTCTPVIYLTSKKVHHALGMFGNIYAGVHHDLHLRANHLKLTSAVSVISAYTQTWSPIIVPDGGVYYRHYIVLHFSFFTKPMSLCEIHRTWANFFHPPVRTPAFNTSESGSKKCPIPAVVCGTRPSLGGQCFSSKRSTVSRPPACTAADSGRFTASTTRWRASSHVGGALSVGGIAIETRMSWTETGDIRNDPGLFCSTRVRSGRSVCVSRSPSNGCLCRPPDLVVWPWEETRR